MATLLTVPAVSVMQVPLDQQVLPGLLLPRWDIHFREGQVEPLPRQAMVGLVATPVPVATMVLTTMATLAMVALRGAVDRRAIQGA